MFMVDQDLATRQSGFDDVGELEYRVADGENDVDRLTCCGRVALEVDAAMDCLIGRDGDGLQMRGRCCELGRFPCRSLFGRFEFVDL